MDLNFSPGHQQIEQTHQARRQHEELRVRLELRSKRHLAWPIGKRDSIRKLRGLAGREACLSVQEQQPSKSIPGYCEKGKDPGYGGDS